MLKPKEYAKLYSLLSGNGIILLTRPSEYEEMHLFPNVYPHIEADTAGMMIFEDGKVDIEAVKRQYPRFMVKDSVKSVKGTEFPAFFDSKVTQDEFDMWMEVFYKYRGNLLTGSICIKEYLDLKRYNGRTNEFRVFYADHKIISICRNSLQPDHTATPLIMRNYQMDHGRSLRPAMEVYRVYLRDRMQEHTTGLCIGHWLQKKA